MATAVNKKDTPEKQERTPVVTPPVRSGRKVSFKEFISSNSFTPEFLAGFRMYLKVNKKPEYMSETEWGNTLKAYKNRKI